MLRKFLTNGVMIPLILCLQVLPLVIFPASSYALTTQEWWLPLLLSIFTVIGLVQILLRKSVLAWPWYLLSFSQGFNIISRIMMLLPHATVSGDNGQLQANGPYLVIAFASMLLSAFELWYCELPEVRQKLAARATPKATAKAVA
jgi:hypothetical protein